MGISVSDQPVSSILNFTEKDTPDTLETGAYAETLAAFIKECETPLTIGVQGEWGSGKTSLLNMIKENIEQDERSSGRKKVKGADEYKCIWINTWEHSLLKDPEKC